MKRQEGSKKAPDDKKQPAPKTTADNIRLSVRLV